MTKRIPWSELIWYALQVPPQKEFVAQTILNKKGIDSYVPARKEWRRRNKYTKTKELRAFPVAPRYVFAGFPRRIPLWFDIFNLPVINGVVGLNGEPLIIPYKHTAKQPGLRGIMDKWPNGIVAPKEQKYMHTHGEFKVGDTAEVLDGPFEGQRVPVVEIKGGDAMVHMLLFGTVQEVKIALENLVKAA